MKKIIQTLTSATVMLYMAFLPLIVSFGIPISAHAQANVSASDYQLGFVSVATSTWQKGFDQDFTYSQSAALQNITINAFVKNPPVSIYLVPAYPISSAQMSAAVAANYFGQLTFGTPSAKTSASDPNMPTSAVAAPPANPSAYFYGSAPDASTRWGYYVGTMTDWNPTTKILRTQSSLDATTSVPSFNFAWLPLGSYYVYLAEGIETYSTTTKKASQAYYLPSKPTAFSIQPPPVAYSEQYISKKDSVAVGPYARAIEQLGYSPTLVPLPVAPAVSRQNATSGILETDIVASAMSAAPVTLTPAPTPVILITDPNPTDNTLSESSGFQLEWLANFKRSAKNNTGLHLYDGIAIVPPYGFGTPFFQGSNVNGYNSIDGLFGRGVLYLSALSPIGIVLTILDLFGVFDTKEKPFAVSLAFDAIPYNPAAGASQTTTQSYALPDGDSYLELGKRIIPPKSFTYTPAGNYILRVTATWPNGNGTVGTIIATSSPLVFTQPILQPTDLATTSSTYPSMFLGTGTGTGTSSSVAGSSTRTSPTTPPQPVAPSQPAAPSTPTNIPTVPTAPAAPVVPPPPVINGSGSYHTSAPPAQIMTVPPQVTSVCPDQYTLNTTDMLCIANVQQHGHGSSPLSPVVAPNPVYTCPTGYVLNSANTVCTSQVVSSVPQENPSTTTASVWDSLIEWFSKIFN